MAHYRSCIVAHGARTPVGLNASSTAAAVRAGVSRLGEHPRFHDETGEAYVVAMDRTLDEFDSRKRMLVLGTSALHEVLDQLAVPPQTEVPIYVGVRDNLQGFTESDNKWLAAGLHSAATSRCKPLLHTVQGGNAAGLVALALAQQVVESGKAQLAIAGGVDSHIAPDFLEQLDEAGRCKSVANKWGYPPGEGAAMLAVCSTVLAKQLRLPVLAGVVGVGNALEKSHLGSDQVCLGTGLTEAIKSALDAFAWPTETIAAQYCDINGEFYRSDEFMYAALKLPATAFDGIERYVAPADCWGDVGAASGPLFAILAGESGRRGYARGNLALLWAGSENGKRAACVLEIAAGSERRAV